MKDSKAPIARPDVLAGYAAEAPELIVRFEALSAAEVLAPVADLLPTQPAYILDVGAGTGRDAAWLVEQGHRVLAAEPVEALRAAGIALHPSPAIDWVDDRLPRLSVARGRGERYDLILLVGVLHHLPPNEQAEAIAVLAAMIGPQGRLIASLRHGAGPPRRACFPAEPDRLATVAREAGLRLVARRAAPSLQSENRAAGVSWTWLCLDR